MAFASSLFCSSKFLEHTHSLTNASLCLHVLTTTRMYVPLPFSIFGSFHPNVRFFFLCQNIGWRYRMGRKKKLCPAKRKHNSCFFFFFCWAQFFAPPFEWEGLSVGKLYYPVTDNT